MREGGRERERERGSMCVRERRITCVSETERKGVRVCARRREVACTLDEKRADAVVREVERHKASKRLEHLYGLGLRV